MGKDTRLTDISTRDVARAIERRRAETFTRAADRPRRKAKAFPLKNATVNGDIIGMLRRILSRAETVWEVKPIARINWKALRLPEPPPEVRLYSPAQQEAWLAQCAPAARFALTLLLTYGMRLNELFFPLDAFDPSGPRLSINKRKRGALLLPLRADDGREIARRIAQAKTAGLDTIWFDEEVRPARFGQPERVLLHPRGYLCIQSRLRVAAKRAGITLPRVIHGARHHAGTTMLSQSGNLRMTQQLLGHADITSTLRYAHALETDLRAALEGRAPMPTAESTSGAPGSEGAEIPIVRTLGVRRRRKAS
jgi:integrase